MKRRLLPSFLTLGSSAAAQSGATPTVPALPAAAPTLNFQTRPLTILNGKVTVQVSPSLRYLDPNDSRTVIVDLWGNPPGAADDVLGMLVPSNTTPASGDGWAIVLTENRDGHVSDSDAASTNYTQLAQGHAFGRTGQQRRPRQGRL